MSESSDDLWKENDYDDYFVDFYDDFEYGFGDNDDYDDDGFGDNDLVLPRFDDLERALFTVFALSLTFFREDVSVSSQALLKLS